MYTCRGGSNEGEKIYEMANTMIWPTPQQVAMAKTMSGCYYNDRLLWFTPRQVVMAKTMLGCYCHMK